jgi:hypothetical protein
LIGESLQIRVGAALQILRKLHGKLAELTLQFIGNHVNAISPSWLPPSAVGVRRCKTMLGPQGIADAHNFRRVPRRCTVVQFQKSKHNQRRPYGHHQ